MQTMDRPSTYVTRNMWAPVDAVIALVNSQAYAPEVPEVSIYKIRDWIRKKFDAIYISIRPLCYNEHPGILDFVIKDCKIYDEDMDWFGTSGNPSMVPLIEENMNAGLVEWETLCKNPSPQAIRLIESRPNRIVWRELSRNPNATHLLRENPDKIHWRNLCENPADWALDAIEANPDKIEWVNLCRNTNKRAIKLLENNIQNVNWYSLSLNSAAMGLLKAHPEKIVWECLSENPSPEAVELLMQNPEKIDWSSFVCNPSAMEYLEKNRNKIKNWHNILMNPAIFEVNCEALRESRAELHKELISVVFRIKSINALMD